MKHISKTVLLFGTIAMLASTVPAQAMEPHIPANIQQEVTQKQGFFAKWTQKAFDSMHLEKSWIVTGRSSWPASKAIKDVLEASFGQFAASWHRLLPW